MPALFAASYHAVNFFQLCLSQFRVSLLCSMSFAIGEGKRWNEFAEWHVAWLAG